MTNNNIIKFEEKQDMSYLRDLVHIAMKSGNYAGRSAESLLNLMLTAKDLGISPMKAINNGFHIIKGNVCMSTHLMADRIRKDGHSIKIPEWTSEKCVIIGVRKDNGDSIKFEYNMEDAKRAGLATGKPDSNWTKSPKHMLYCRAMSTIARTLFPDVIGAAYSEDEKYDIMNIPPDKRPSIDPEIETIPMDIQVDPSDRIITQEEVDGIFQMCDGDEKKVGKALAWAGFSSGEIKKKHYDKIAQAYEAKKQKEEVLEAVAV